MLRFYTYLYKRHTSMCNAGKGGAGEKCLACDQFNAVTFSLYMHFTEVNP